MSKDKKNIYLNAKNINSKYSLHEYLKENLKHHKTEYSSGIPDSHMIVFIDYFIDKAKKTIMEDQKGFIDKLNAIKKRIMSGKE